MNAVLGKSMLARFSPLSARIVTAETLTNTAALRTIGICDCEIVLVRRADIASEEREKGFGYEAEESFYADRSFDTMDYVGQLALDDDIVRDKLENVLRGCIEPS